MVHWPCSRDPQIKHSGDKNERGKNKKTGLVGCGGDYFGDVVGGRHRKGQQP